MTHVKGTAGNLLEDSCSVFWGTAWTIMPNFVGSDKPTTDETRQHSGLWASPVGLPSVTGGYT